MRHAVNKVGGAVQGVDDPHIIRILALYSAAFLAAETVVRVSLAQDLDNRLLRAAIDLGDKVIGALGLDFHRVRAFIGAFNQFAGLARRAQSHVQHGFHRAISLFLRNGKERGESQSREGRTVYRQARGLASREGQIPAPGEVTGASGSC